MNYFTSDEHHYHYNIIRFCNRPFNNTTEMTDTIINNHNSMVTDRDEVYHLGDFAYKAAPENIVTLFEKLKGKHHVILGNHDKAVRIAYSKRYLDKLIISGKLEIIGGDAILDNTISISKMVNIDGQLLFLSHYSLESWPSAFRAKSIMVHGHSHGNLPISKYRKIDVGVDAISFFPISFIKIMEIMNAKVEFSEKEDE